MTHGEFKYWPQVFEMWTRRRLGDETIKRARIDFTQDHYNCHAAPEEMQAYCSRRQ